jgi:hypothetical protein
MRRLILLSLLFVLCFAIMGYAEECAFSVVKRFYGKSGEMI